MQAQNSDINDMFSRTGSYPFENLSKANRWVKLADSLDWKHIEDEYNKRLSNQSRGACNKPARMVIGAMPIKHTLCCSGRNHCRHLGESLYAVSRWSEVFLGGSHLQSGTVCVPTQTN